MRGEIKQRGLKGTWFVRIYTGRVNGKREYKNASFPTKKEAEDWAVEIAHRKNQGAVITSSKMTLAVYLEQWLDTSIKGTIKPRTFDGYKANLARHITPMLGPRPLSKLTALDIQAAYNAMGAAGLSPRTIQYVAMTLSHALKDAVTNRMLTFNPCDGAKIPRQVQGEMKVFTPDQARRFLAVANLTPPWGPLFSVALTTGMRPSEYLALQWGDIDFNRRTVTAQRSLDQKPDGSWTFSDLKTKGSRRTIRLHVDVTETLKQHKAQQATATQGVMDSALVFATSNGTPYGRNNVKRAFRTIIKKTNKDLTDESRKLPVIRLYDLRHTAATLALAAGVPIKIVQEMLGHSSAVVTLNVYSHVLPHMQDDAADRMEALLRTVEPEAMHTGCAQNPFTA